MTRNYFVCRVSIICLKHKEVVCRNTKTVKNVESGNEKHCLYFGWQNYRKFCCPEILQGALACTSGRESWKVKWGEDFFLL